MALWSVPKTDSRWIIIEPNNKLKKEILKKIATQSTFDTTVYYGWHGKAIKDKAVELFREWEPFLERLKELSEEKTAGNVLIILDEPTELSAHSVPDVLKTWIGYAHKYESSVVLLCNRLLKESPPLLRQKATVFAREESDKEEVNKCYSGRKLVWYAYDDMWVLYSE